MTLTTLARKIVFYKSPAKHCNGKYISWDHRTMVNNIIRIYERKYFIEKSNASFYKKKNNKAMSKYALNLCESNQLISLRITLWFKPFYFNWFHRLSHIFIDHSLIMPRFSHISGIHHPHMDCIHFSFGRIIFGAS